MILTIRTSSGPHGLALFDQNQLVGKQVSKAMGIKTTALSRLLQDLLAQAGCSMAQVTKIIVDCGPGGLASTRVGVGFANALAYASKAELVGANALELQWLSVRSQTSLPILSLRPAAIGNAYWQLYDQSGLLTEGHGPLEARLNHIQAQHGLVALAGPIKRLRLTEAQHRDHALLDCEEIDFECFLQATEIPARPDAGLSLLDPIMAADHMVNV